MNIIKTFFQFRSYFWKILFTIGIVSIGFLVVMLSTIAYYMVVPLGQRATDDLASIISHAAERWESLPTGERGVFVEQMWHKHNLRLTSAEASLPDSTSLLPYLYFLEASLQKQLGNEIHIKTSRDKKDEKWFWADVPLSNTILRFGFSRSRIGVKPSVAFFVVLITGFCMTFFTATLLTRRLTVTIERLYQAAQLIGKGQWPDPVREEGPEELIVLAREFNRMNIQMRELLTNRTTLLAGISHDLRTPLTQIQLALAMLPNDGGDTQLMNGVYRDLNAVNRLIGQALQISLELDKQEKEPTQIAGALDHIIVAARRGNQTIEWSTDKSCSFMLNPLALQRIVSNLLENAIRYGEGKPVSVECNCDKDFLTIEVLDHGPGIPPEQREAVFQPFFRLEKSRSSVTGGSGLGLAIVRQLADANGWTVKLLERDGGGTCARLIIPIE
ncbi:MAG: ATP-binding protein [Candidatus Thiodiazotropha sp.]|nr:ATP-binding protein [Candidatus Thiodiazotropha sp.]MCM8884767.1 ATP-binding protein [Candidatus Thiodiazotropha sp.]MCM8921957.1 ATP-binding protein [Candidatus Thiodiazotropha sp.]